MQALLRPPIKNETDEQFQLILNEYGGWLRKTIVRLCPKNLGIQPEDIEQEVALRLWRALRRQEKLDNPVAYIYRLVSTATVDAMRRARAQRQDLTSGLGVDPGEDEAARFQLVASGPSPERRAVEQEILARLGGALARLPENRRSAVRLYLQGFKIQEIADLLGWTEPKARNLLYRGLQTLRQELAAAGFEYEPR